MPSPGPLLLARTYVISVRYNSITLVVFFSAIFHSVTGTVLGMFLQLLGG